MKADSMNESVLPEALQRRDRGGIGFPLTALLFSSPPAEPLRPDSNHYEFLNKPTLLLYSNIRFCKLFSNV